MVVPSVFAIERQQFITEQLQKNRRVYVAELSQALGVTEETIRRDLRELERSGAAIRSHGGAVLPGGCAPDWDLPQAPPPAAAVTPPAAAAADPREQMAAAAAGLLAEHSLIMADASAEACAVIAALEQPQVTVLTCSWAMITALASRPNLRFIASGGEADPRRQAFTGSDALRTIRRYHADAAVVGAQALHAEYGCMCTDAADCDLKTAMLEHSAGRIVLAEAGCFGQAGRCTFLALSDTGQLVTDRAPSAEWIKILGRSRVALYY